ncbi:MAG: stalk domain-containing protein [Defluviitaleaceae bacterium]|nr:stalk domain-containing protein [Defluviitaleaceae bacterium]
MVIFANTGGVIRELFFGVNVMVDGVPQHFDYDMRPFIIGGRTYLPVRGIADTLGVEINWEGSTNTVYLWSGMSAISTPAVAQELPTPTPPVTIATYTWLDQMGHFNHRVSAARNNLTSWPSGGTATDGTVFERGILFSLNNSSFHGGAAQDDTGAWVSYHDIEFPLSNRYNIFAGTLVCYGYQRHNANAAQQGSQFIFYGDGRLIYTSPPISEGTIPVEFNVDVSNVSTLRIYVHIPNMQAINAARGCTNYVGIVNARFE